MFSFLRDARFLTSILIASLFAGCVSITPPTQHLSELRTEESKNYRLKEVYSVNVGEPVVVRKSYFYKEFESQDRAVVENDFRVVAKGALRPSLTYNGRKDEQLLVLGTTTVDKKSFRIISIGQLSDGTPVGILVSRDTGVATGKGVWRNPVTGAWQSNNLGVTLDPPDTSFKVVNRVEVDRSKPYENYEIIYTGRLGENVTFVYREYTPDNLAKPAFYQNLTYNLAGAKQIRFRKLQIEVAEASNEQIKLKVVSDN